MTASPAPQRRGLAGLLMRLLRRLSPKRAEDAERESGEWYLICPKCGTARSYSELG